MHCGGLADHRVEWLDGLIQSLMKQSLVPVNMEPNERAHTHVVLSTLARFDLTRAPARLSIFNYCFVELKIILPVFVFAPVSLSRPLILEVHSS